MTLALLLWAIVGPSGRRRSLAGLAVVAAKPPSKLQAHTRLFPGAGQRLLFRLRRLSGDAKAIGRGRYPQRPVRRHAHRPCRRQ